MPIQALVNLSTNEVTQVESTTNPPFLNGYRWIKESDFVEGQSASPGMIWDGLIPASFAPAPPPPEVAQTLPESLDEMQANLDAQQEELNRLRQIATGASA